MDLLTRLNRAMDYIEENISEDIDLEAVARVTLYSAYHFQRIFCYITDIALSEYIRRRKMTLAAFELQNSEIKVIDLAIKYGYDSADSFSRAFAKLHGVNPSQARNKGAMLKAYPKLTFHITIKGDTEMNYRIEEKEAFKVVGVHKRFNTDSFKNKQSIPEFWSELRKNGTLDKIVKLGNNNLKGVIGVCTNGVNCEFDYYIAVTSDELSNQGLEVLEIPKSTFAVFHFIGPLHETMPKVEKMIFTEWMPTSGYEPGEGADLEVYSDKPHDASDYEFWYYFPVVKK